MGQVRSPRKPAKFVQLVADYKSGSLWGQLGAGSPVMTTTLYALDDKGRVWKMVTLNAVDKWVEVPHAETPI